MRLILMAALALAACATGGPSVYSPSELAEIERELNNPAVRARIEAAAEEGRRQHAAANAMTALSRMPYADMQRRAREMAEAEIPPRTPRRGQAVTRRANELVTAALDLSTQRARREHEARLTAAERSRQEAYCRSLSADIAMAGSSGADIIVRGLMGVPLEQQSSLYHSCMSGFARSDAYLMR
jgi:hypothetical protein